MDRGDIYLVDLEPIRGHEQRSRRPVFILTRAAFNKHSLPMVCPITTGGASVRLGGFTVSLATSGLKTTGVVLCNQIRSLNIKKRRGRRVERAPDPIIDDVMAVGMDVLE
jgi:mRNA interferase ChpB